MTSSCASILRVSPHPLVFSEADWNEQSIKVIEEQGSSADSVVKYEASKTLAEKGEPRCSDVVHTRIFLISVTVLK